MHHLTSICGTCYFMFKKHRSWKNNEIFYCHLLTRNLASFSVRQLIDGPTRRWMSFPCFSLDDAFKLSILYVLHTKSTQATAQKVDITYRLKTSFIYCSLNSANPYNFKHLNNGGSIQNDNTDCRCEIFYRRPDCLEASQ